MLVSIEAFCNRVHLKNTTPRAHILVQLGSIENLLRGAVYGHCPFSLFRFSLELTQSWLSSDHLTETALLKTSATLILPNIMVSSRVLVGWSPIRP